MEKLKLEFPTRGWSQILGGRKEMLDAYDRARAQSRGHEVQVFHGNVAEAAFRRWLAGFLPKRYGIAPGYVVSPGRPSSAKAPHFDVIIYDQLDAPVLWIEDDPDASAQGKSLAIPVEYVKSVLEVKASFSSETVDHSLEHLSDLLPLMGGPDDPREEYKIYLPATFCCGAIFFELREEAAYDRAALDSMIGGIGLRGFFGGVILRGERHRKPLAGRVNLLQGDVPIQSTVGRDKESLFQAPLGESVKIADGVNIASMLTWSEPAFSQFAFDLIAMMQGTYRAGKASSWYGMGTSVHEDRKLTSK
jgi:hypothetical protein